ncbi:S-layer homology domain-containing protein [Paenibacillus sp. FSL H8-0317]|uniref:S-layer homology domain-containing protein n=1 Tax=Paenibacillus sp. FSL H8-0317 TaxID=2921385 RepID=UPI003243F604
MFKRVVLSSMVLALCLSATPVQAAEAEAEVIQSLYVSYFERPTDANAFIDLKDLDAATKAKFDAMISAGIFQGVSDNIFGLKEEMNRAQFAKVAALVFNLNVDTTPRESSFSDVKVDNPTLPYIEAIQAAGITSGMGNGEFNPEGLVNKEQLATFLVRGLGMEEKVESSSIVGVSNWAAGYVQKALDLGLLENAPDGTFDGKEEASRGLLVTGGFETARTFEKTKPLEVSGSDFAAGNTLHLTLTVGIDVDSIDLSKITINSVALNPKLDSFALSEDKKMIIIKLHDGFQLDMSKTPVIAVNGLKTQFGNDVKNGESKKIPVTLTEPPVKLTPTPGPTNSNQGTDPTPGPTNPNQGTDPTPGPTNPNQGTDPTPGPTNPNQGMDPTPGPTNPNQGTDPTPGPTNPNQS